MTLRGSRSVAGLSKFKLGVVMLAPRVVVCGGERGHGTGQRSLSDHFHKLGVPLPVWALASLQRTGLWASRLMTSS